MKKRRASSPMENVQKITIHYLSEPLDHRASLEKDIMTGMTANPKWFPTKYMYDEEGAALFEKMSKEPNYYIYHAETEILHKHAKEIIEFVRPQEMVELGSGASTKTRILIEAMQSIGCYKYVPLEISEKILCHSVEQLTAEYPWLRVDGYIGDFNTDLPRLIKSGRRLMVFLGSTIGNFKSKAERRQFLLKLSATLTSGDSLLLGVDLLKDKEKIIAGYGDQKGLARQFSLRAIRIMNEQLGANFMEENFTTHSDWNPESSCVEISLVATHEAKVFFESLNVEISFSEGEGIKIGFSTKFTKEGITEELAGIGLDVVAWYTDTSEIYAVLLALPRSGQ